MEMEGTEKWSLKDFKMALEEEIESKKIVMAAADKRLRDMESRVFVLVDLISALNVMIRK